MRLIDDMKEFDDVKRLQTSHTMGENERMSEEKNTVTYVIMNGLVKQPLITIQKQK